MKQVTRFVFLLLGVYRTDASKGVQMLQRYSLPQMFAEAKARSQGQ